jgi:hypothetical protein
MKSKAEPLSEPFSTVPCFVDALSGINTLGTVTHLIFTARQISTLDGSLERLVQARLIVPTDQLTTIGRSLLAGHVAPLCGEDQDGNPVELH